MPRLLLGVPVAAVVTAPTSMRPPACRRIEPFVLPNTLSAAITMWPPLAASTSMVPALPTPCVRMSAPAVKVTSLPERMLTEPVPVAMSRCTTMSPAASRVWSSTLPAPWALTAPSATSPTRVMEPVLLRSTMFPSLPVPSEMTRVRRLLDTLSVFGVAASRPWLVTRFRLAPTPSTLTPSSSSRKIPPRARAVILSTLVSRWFTA